MRSALARALTLPLVVAGLAVPAAAHVGGLGGAGGDGAVPTWLTVATGGVVVGGSFLFTSLLTDHEAIRDVNGWRLALPVPEAGRALAVRGLRAASVLALAAVVVTGVVGPADPTRNFAILFVWVGWWAGYTMSVYAVAPTWSAVNPWRALADALPTAGDATYPERLGAWPAVAGLLALVWLEVVSPVAADAGLLVAVVLGYTAVTLAGAARYGPETWFGVVDPVSRVFRSYGRVAPFRRTDGGVALGLPTTALVDPRADEEPGGVAFVVALLWVTTYDGLVATPAWAAAARPVVALGVPPLVLYLVVVLGGFVAFYLVYAAAARRARRSADSYVAAGYLRRYFAPALLPIAAGYHVAHFLGYFLGLSPALVGAAAAPLDPPAATFLSVPDWFGTVRLSFVVLGHLLAVWVAHALSFELFPGVLRPVRSQYPFVVVMILYTTASMWVVVQPFTPPPYV